MEVLSRVRGGNGKGSLTTAVQNWRQYILEWNLQALEPNADASTLDHVSYLVKAPCRQTPSTRVVRSC